MSSSVAPGLIGRLAHANRLPPAPPAVLPLVASGRIRRPPARGPRRRCTRFKTNAIRSIAGRTPGLRARIDPNWAVRKFLLRPPTFAGWISGIRICIRIGLQSRDLQDESLMRLRSCAQAHDESRSILLEWLRFASE